MNDIKKTWIEKLVNKIARKDNYSFSKIFHQLNEYKL